MARKNTVRKFIELDREDAEWFNSTYPNGQFSWILTMLLKKFREAHATTPEQYATAGAKELKKLLEES